MSVWQPRDPVKLTRTLVESFKRDLIHFALNDPYYSPYDVIGNPHYSASYPWTLEGLGLELGLQLRLGLHASSPKPNVSACVTRPFHDVCLHHHHWLNYASSILPHLLIFCWISLRHTYFYNDFITHCVRGQPVPWRQAPLTSSCLVIACSMRLDREIIG